MSIILLIFQEKSEEFSPVYKKKEAGSLWLKSVWVLLYRNLIKMARQKPPEILTIDLIFLLVPFTT